MANHQILGRSIERQVAAVTLELAKTSPPGLLDWLQSLQTHSVDIDFHRLFYVTAHLIDNRHAFHKQLMSVGDDQITQAADKGFVMAILEAEGFEEAAKAVEGLDATGDRQELLVKALVTESANIAPELGAKWLEANGTAEQIELLLPDFMFLWAANQDHLSAEKWIVTREASPLRDAALRSFVKGAAIKDLELALRTADLIEDPAIREQAISEAHRANRTRG